MLEADLSGVFLFQSPGNRNYGLQFFGISEEEKNRIRRFLNYNHSYGNAPFHAVVQPAQIFFQGDQENWLFIEFWSNEIYWRPLVELLRTELNLFIQEKNPELG